MRITNSNLPGLVILVDRIKFEGLF